MHPFLTMLGVAEVVQDFFAPYYTIDENGNLNFFYGDASEMYGPGFHKIPATDGFWIAGDAQSHSVRQIVIGHSAMNLIAFLSVYRHRFKNFDNLLFISTGSGLSSPQLSYIRERCGGKSCVLIFGNDLFGRIADVKVAAAISALPLSITLNGPEFLEVIFRFHQYYFPAHSFTLHAFEQVTGFRFKGKTFKRQDVDLKML